MGPASESSGRPRGFYVLVTLVAAQGLSGVAGGAGLVVDPSGEALGLPIAFLAGSPFADYLVPGLILLVLLGIGPLVVAWGLWRRRGWAWTGSLFVGGGLLAWLGVEIAIIGVQDDPPLQLVYGVVGLAILVLSLGLRPGSRGRSPPRPDRH